MLSRVTVVSSMADATAVAGDVRTGANEGGEVVFLGIEIKLIPDRTY